MKNRQSSSGDGFDFGDWIRRTDGYRGNAIVPLISFVISTYNRRDVLLACHATGFTPAGGPKFYDEPSGRICFRLRHDFLPRLLDDYTAATLIYTGE